MPRGRWMVFSACRASPEPIPRESAMALPQNADLVALTAWELATAIRQRSFSAAAAVEAYLKRIARSDDQIGAFLHIAAEEARAAAAVIDRRLANGEDPGPLCGVPVAVKDNIAVPGMPCTCGSLMLKDYRPVFAAHVVDRLQAAGAVIIGKTNLDEFAMGSSTENSALRITRNPWNITRVPGGSSGGSAAAVAAGLAPLALGSDTGGSIRQPAAFCGCVGLKPTYGLVSRYGLVAFGSSLDQIGPISRTVRDAALVLSVIAGPDPRDATCRQAAAPDYLANLSDDMRGLRIGLPRQCFAGDGLHPEIRAAVQHAVEKLKAGGATAQEVDLPLLDYAVPAYYIIATAEAASNLARYDGIHYGHRTSQAETIVELMSKSRAEGFGPEIKRRIMLGTYVLSAGYYDAYYLRALKVRSRLDQDFAAAFAQADVLAMPVTPTTAFCLGEKTGDPLAMYLADIYTLAANLAGLPAIAVPVGFDSSGLPIGIQFLAPRFRDDLVLRAGAACEKAVAITARTATARP